MSFSNNILFILSLLCLCCKICLCHDILVLTVATEKNDALDRFLRSCSLNGFEVKVLGEGSYWKGGNVAKSTGGGQKVNILKDELAKSTYRPDQLVLFVDSYDVVFMQNVANLLKEYERFESKVIFSAEEFCWPQPSLKSLYPEVKPGEKRYLNSGGFIGPVANLIKIVNHTPINDDDDDQLYYTNIFLDSKLRTLYDIELDKTSRIFQNLNGAFDDVELHFNDETGYLFNKIFSTTPIIAHGNGPIKVEFNSLSNYLVHSWTPTHGCQHCNEDNVELNDLSESTKFQLSASESFNQTFGHEYLSVSWLEENLEEEIARKKVFGYCLAIEDCKYVFAVDSIAQLENPETLDHLIRMNRSIIAPLLTIRGKAWSNFWGALGTDGYYARSSDYMDIISYNMTGIWNVPLVRSAYLITRPAVLKLIDITNTEMNFAYEARNKNIFMFVDNQVNFGYLINADNYTKGKLHNDLWQIMDNPQDWEEKYIHPQYFNTAKPEVMMTDVAQPCPDVFWFPLLSETFCKHLIEEVENYGQWSNGDNYDPRLEGGYENVPTRDIHMRQIGWEEHWLHVLEKYVHKIQKKLFQGYDDKPWARMNFVVRYKPDEQPSLRPHHDASSYTLNIGLNQPEKDYKGGGVHFNRYNCSIIDTRVGWAVVSPGRVTHLHEGLPTTEGTRYIFVTFVNP
ncbi:Multifunctional procollagen lysine hydroxylase and glycosyltransferase LH3 [Schistosoma japonicum]|nr:Multifunctional procollagen lysine hydroxylase and glycosyltransferase LH3 [Schistosoma japonicum]KAH8866938.1 Multifunctional procollagen lysine hydroxylase and glycosyltransferase LH3 [Schistosoma japonicum]